MSFLDTKPEIERFPVNADSIDDILYYIKNRRIQALSDPNNVFYWDGNYQEVQDWGVVYELVERPSVSDKRYIGVYLKRELDTTDNKLTPWLQQRQKDLNEDGIRLTVVTCVDEGIEHLLGDVDRIVLDKPRNWIEYTTIESYYGNKTAERTGMHMINHIEEGLFILQQVNASELAKRAYCLHPNIQGDPDLKIFYTEIFPKNPSAWDSRVLILATEYRNIANAYLSHVASREDFALSPLEDVNTMLIADKVQNRKDFDIFHKGSHPKSDRLVEYFGQWLRRLNISEEQFQSLRDSIVDKCGESLLSITKRKVQ